MVALKYLRNPKTEKLAAIPRNMDAACNITARTSTTRTAWNRP